MLAHCVSINNVGDTFTEFGWEKSPVIFNNIACNEAHSMLVQCVNEQSIGVHNCGENNIAGVICEMPSPDNLTISTSVSACVTFGRHVLCCCFLIKSRLLQIGCHLLFLTHNQIQCRKLPQI